VEKRFNLKLGEDLYDWIKQKAYREDQSMASVVREVLEEKRQK